MTAPLYSNSEPVLIAVDAAVQPASLAVLRGETVASQTFAAGDVFTDAWLAPALDDCLGAADLRLADVNGFAVTTGPGMFTGIRVGLATCLGLAAPRRLPVAGVLTLEALAAMGCAAETSTRWVASCVDARRGQVYGALYRLPSRCALPLPAAIEPQVADPGIFVEAVAEITATPLLIGSGTRYFRTTETTRGEAANATVDIPPGFSIGTLSEPLAVAAGRLVARAWTPEGPVGCHPPVPHYIRPADVRPARNPLLSAG
jgi:tRNA threonylcarbamoyladenosine biosynthesis protein TsaB